MVEEVSLRKQGADRLETVRDTVRHDDVMIEQMPADALAATTTKPMMPAKSAL